MERDSWAAIGGVSWRRASRRKTHDAPGQERARVEDKKAGLTLTRPPGGRKRGARRSFLRGAGRILGVSFLAAVALDASFLTARR